MKYNMYQEKSLYVPSGKSEGTGCRVDFGLDDIFWGIC
ncbi:hypothetical protein ASZ90_009173 [hydrocarbon metagenome]|uniref:Uncharacterized protein n=1 Tax=hydrocarbon metagenome TaxID=938273 RepID=A0A0W8FJK1_9ZZZZ